MFISFILEEIEQIEREYYTFFILFKFIIMFYYDIRYKINLCLID